MTHVTCRLTAKNRDSSRTLRSVIEYGLTFVCIEETDGQRDGHRAFTYRRSLQEAASFDNRLFSESSPVVITLREIIFGNLLIVFFCFLVFILRSTPPTRTEAFEEFKKDAGSEIYRILCENKGRMDTHARAHTHPFNGPSSGTTQVSQYQRNKKLSYR